MCVRLLASADEDSPPGVEANIMKIRGTEILQDVQDIAVDCLARRGLWFDPKALEPHWNGTGPGPEPAPGLLGEFLLGRAYTIWGGSNEIQRNILAKAAMHLS